MANIDTYLENIMQARYGRDVRQSIHDGIEAINEDTENAVDIATQAKGEATTAVNSAQAYANQALAHEQQAQIYRNQAEQFKDEAFSGTPEGYADLVAKVNSIYRQTATSYNVVGTSEGSVLAHTIYGMSVQDGTPTPDSPVEIQSAKADFRCTGKNLIPYPYLRQSGFSSQGMTGTYGDDGVITINKEVGSATAYFGLYNNELYNNGKMLTPNTRYKLSMSLENTNNASVYISVNQRDIAAIRNKASGNYEYTFTTPNELLGTIQMAIYFGANVVETNCKVKVMLTLADVDQTYEVNQHKDVTTNLTLRSIEVASTDDYTYERDGKYYIADTIDWSEDKGYQITRRVERFNVNKLTAGNNAIFASITNTNWDYTKYILPKTSSIAPQVYNNYFVPTNNNGINGDDGNGKTYFNVSNHLLYIRIDEMTSQADWNTWMSNHSDMYVDLILATPTTEPITSEQAQALLSLKTYDEATSISATGDIEPSLDLEYSKDRNTALALTGHNLAHKNALKLNDINTALIEMGGN